MIDIPNGGGETAATTADVRQPNVEEIAAEIVAHAAGAFQSAWTDRESAKTVMAWFRGRTIETLRRYWPKVQP